MFSFFNTIFYIVFFKITIYGVLLQKGWRRLVANEEMIKTQRDTEEPKREKRQPKIFQRDSKLTMGTNWPHVAPSSNNCLFQPFNGQHIYTHTYTCPLNLSGLFVSVNFRLHTHRFLHSISNVCSFFFIHLQYCKDPPRYPSCISVPIASAAESRRSLRHQKKKKSNFGVPIKNQIRRWGQSQSNGEVGYWDFKLGLLET